MRSFTDETSSPTFLNLGSFTMNPDRYTGASCCIISILLISPEERAERALGSGAGPTRNGAPTASTVTQPDPGRHRPPRACGQPGKAPGPVDESFGGTGRNVRKFAAGYERYGCRRAGCGRLRRVAASTSGEPPDGPRRVAAGSYGSPAAPGRLRPPTAGGPAQITPPQPLGWRHARVHLPDAWRAESARRQGHPGQRHPGVPARREDRRRGAERHGEVDAVADD